MWQVARLEQIGSLVTVAHKGLIIEPEALIDLDVELVVLAGGYGIVEIVLDGLSVGRELARVVRFRVEPAHDVLATGSIRDAGIRLPANGVAVVASYSVSLIEE